MKDLYDYEDDSTLDYSNEWLRGLNYETDVMPDEIIPVKKFDYESERLKIIKSYTNEISGVYMITNVVDDKIYIGSASDIPGRWRLHQFDLLHKIHHSYLLQEDWDRLGGERNFKIETIWLAESDIDRNDIFFMEQLYLDRHSPEYNIQKDVRYVKSNYNPKETAAKRVEFIKSLKNKNKYDYVKKRTLSQSEQNIRSYERYVRHIILNVLRLKIKPLKDRNVKIWRYDRSLLYNYKDGVFTYLDGVIKNMEDVKGQTIVKEIASYFEIEISITPQGKVKVLKNPYLR